jgi:maltooligosyltrehalose trehalohydrolase
MGDGAMLRLVANLSNAAMARKSGEASGSAIWGGEARDVMPPWSVSWYLGAR